jgi:glutaredoxin 3
MKKLIMFFACICVIYLLYFTYIAHQPHPTQPVVSNINWSQMNKIEIYTKTYCPYCVMAKNLLQSKGLSFTEIQVDHNQEELEKMLNRSGGRKTVPQIFINDVHVGGYDDLSALEAANKLDALLKK